MLDFKKIFAGMAPGGYDAVSACYFNYRFFYLNLTGGKEGWLR
jgi:hypothetical protein